MNHPKSSRFFQTIILILVLVLFSSLAYSGAIYVDYYAAGANNGNNWEDAYKHLQDALDDAESAKKPVEIRVAQGTYKPDQGANQTPGDRNASFQLIDGVKLIGGYAGVRKPDPNAHDIQAYETILSGDLNDDDQVVNNHEELKNDTKRSENSYHVVTSSETDETAMLVGLTITAGNANGTQKDLHGGGMYNDSGCPKLSSCTFRYNLADEPDGHGGGIYNLDGHMTLIKCAFICNVAAGGGGMVSENGSPVLSDCTFSINWAYDGGGLSNRMSNPVLSGCNFSNNSVIRYGGGIYNGDASPKVRNCTFTKNTATQEGGGMYNRIRSNPILTDCIFRQNSASYGGGMYSWADSNPILRKCSFIGNFAVSGGGMYNMDGNQILTDCKFVGNSAESPWIPWACTGGAIFNWGSSPNLTDSTFAGNSAYLGGAIYDDNGAPSLKNCLMVWNSAEDGGAIYNENNSSASLINCTLVNNFAKNGHAMACGWLFFYEKSSFVEFLNCIIWNGGNEIWNNDASTIKITYTDIQAGVHDPYKTIIWDMGNINVDPLFAAPGYWNSNEISDNPNDDFLVDGDYRLTPCSPCINRGDPNYINEPNETDLDGNPRVIGGRIDMGAYEYPFAYDKFNEGVTPGSWRKYSENPVFTQADSGQWEDFLEGNITVLKDNDEPVNKYKMWYVGGNQFTEGVGIGYATSTDGINWIRNDNNPVLEPGEWWNTEGFSGICVIKDGPVYKLWYEGIDNETARIGYATSTDGINWDINNNPVFSPGNNDAWDNEDVGNPCVIKEGSTYKMWYWGDNILTGIDQIGLAISDDGINWQRAASNPVIAPDPGIWWQDGEGIGTPQVLKVDSGYVMAYHAADQIGTIRIGLATSIDGLEWKKEENPILDLGDENSWESMGVGPGSLIQDTRHLKMWYLGGDASETIKVGLAITCDDIVFDVEVEN